MYHLSGSYCGPMCIAAVEPDGKYATLWNDGRRSEVTQFARTAGQGFAADSSHNIIADVTQVMRNCELEGEFGDSLYVYPITDEGLTNVESANLTRFTLEAVKDNDVKPYYGPIPISEVLAIDSTDGGVTDRVAGAYNRIPGRDPNSLLGQPVMPCSTLLLFENKSVLRVTLRVPAGITDFAAFALTFNYVRHIWVYSTAPQFWQYCNRMAYLCGPNGEPAEAIWGHFDYGSAPLPAGGLTSRMLPLSSVGSQGLEGPSS